MRATLIVLVVLGFGGLLGSVRGDDAADMARLIDDLVQARLDAEGVQRAAPCDDAEFLRRVFLDVQGVVPPPDRAARFLDSATSDKRAALIDELLAGQRFGENLGDIWRRYLISPLAAEQRLPSQRFAGWLAERFNANQGWDRTVRELVTATGTIEQNPAVTYLIEGRHPLPVTDLTDLTSRYFLGVRLNCAQCHDHPFVDWTRENYWGMAAFFAQIQTPGRPKMVYQTGVQDNRQQTLASLASGDALDGFLPRSPILLGSTAPEADNTQPLRGVLADWMTAPQNPYFARAAVNRTWWHLFGRGLVDPVDDMHAGNAPSHPELLDALSRRFAESGFDLKLLYRSILRSRTYQQTSRPGEHPEREEELYARMSIKVLTPEQLYDSLAQVVGPPAKGAGIDQRLGARQEFAQFFADTGDPDPTRYQRGIPQLLRLMNSPQFPGRNLTQLAAKTVPRKRATDGAVDELFLTILSRRPSDDERELALEHLQRGGESAPRELAWALLMSSEFSLNR